MTGDSVERTSLTGDSKMEMGLKGLAAEKYPDGLFGFSRHTTGRTNYDDHKNTSATASQSSPVIVGNADHVGDYTGDKSKDIDPIHLKLPRLAHSTNNHNLLARGEASMTTSISSSSDVAAGHIEGSRRNVDEAAAGSSRIEYDDSGSIDSNVAHLVESTYRVLASGDAPFTSTTILPYADVAGGHAMVTSTLSPAEEAAGSTEGSRDDVDGEAPDNRSQSPSDELKYFDQISSALSQLPQPTKSLQSRNVAQSNKSSLAAKASHILSRVEDLRFSGESPYSVDQSRSTFLQSALPANRRKSASGLNSPVTSTTASILLSVVGDGTVGCSTTPSSELNNSNKISSTLPQSSLRKNNRRPTARYSSPFTDPEQMVAEESSDDTFCEDSFLSTPQSDKSLKFDSTPIGRRARPSRKRKKPDRFDGSPQKQVSLSRNDAHRLNNADLDRFRKVQISRRSYAEEDKDVPGKVLDYHVDISRLQCIVELPPDATPGQRFYLKWPAFFSGDGSKTFIVECPRSAEQPISPGAQRLIRVVPPGLQFDPLFQPELVRQAPFAIPDAKPHSVRVGQRYQVDLLPLPDNGLRHGIPSNNLLTVLMEQYWDANRADDAAQHGEDVVGFVDEGLELNEKMLRMKAAHLAGYSVAQARALFEQILPNAIDIPIAFNLEEKRRVNASVAFSRKDFRRAASDVGRSVCACIVHYYNWKKSDDYQRVKQELSAESDYCAICDDGGELIVCDHCRNAYHFECLQPPLQEVPSGEWFCTHCLKSPAKMRRLPFGPRLDTSPIKMPPKSHPSASTPPAPSKAPETGSSSY